MIRGWSNLRCHKIRQWSVFSVEVAFPARRRGVTVVNVFQKIWASVVLSLALLLASVGPCAAESARVVATGASFSHSLVSADSPDLIGPCPFEAGSVPGTSSHGADHCCHSHAVNVSLFDPIQPALEKGVAQRIVELEPSSISSSPSTPPPNLPV